MDKLNNENTWWSNGIQFECQGSGRCCVSREEYGYVYLTKEDRIRMAQSLEMTTLSFTKKFCDSEDGIFHLKDGLNGDCLFLKNNQCGVYEGRPTQCRTWPFWPEVMNAKTWKKEVKSFCPGVGKGKVWTESEIKTQLQMQIDSENKL